MKHMLWNATLVVITFVIMYVIVGSYTDAAAAIGAGLR